MFRRIVRIIKSWFGAGKGLPETDEIKEEDLVILPPKPLENIPSPIMPADKTAVHIHTESTQTQGEILAAAQEEEEEAMPQQESPQTPAGGEKITLVLTRTGKGKLDTCGKLSYQGTLLCYTLEEAEDKAVPTGTYQILLRNKGGLQATYFLRDRKNHKGMLWLNIPNRYTYLHIGVSVEDTWGGILVGESLENELDGEVRHKINRSEDAYKRIYPVIADFLLKGKMVYLEVKNA